MHSKAGFPIHQNPPLTSNPGAPKAPFAPVTALRVPSTLDGFFQANERLIALLKDKRTLDGIAASFGMLLVAGLYWWQP